MTQEEALKKLETCINELKEAGFSLNISEAPTNYNIGLVAIKKEPEAPEVVGIKPE